MLGIDVNYVSVFIAAVIYMIIGALWYSPFLFAKPWMKLSGMTEKDMKDAQANGMTKTYLISFITALVSAYVLSLFIAISGATNIDEAIKIGFWTSIGFIATTRLTDVLFEKKPLKLYYIDTGYNIVGFLVMAIILTYIV